MSQKIPRAAFTLVSALALGLPALPLRAIMDWKDITDEERAATASTIQPDAGAEVLYRLKQVDDSKVGSATTDEYVRIKIYNENGVKALSKVEIPYDRTTERLKDIAAVVIKPDGSEIALDKKDFYFRDVAKAGKQRVGMCSFSFPSLEPGAIIEYQFKRASNTNLLFLRLDFMENMPVRRVLLRYKTAPLAPPWVMMSFFRLTDGKRRQRASDGFYFYEMRNLKPYVEEPFMPPANEVRPWMAFYPAPGGTPTLFWQGVASAIWSDYDASTKKGAKLVRATAEQITRGIDSPLAQAAALNDYCRTQITNISFNQPDGPADPKPFPKNTRNLDDIIKTKNGSSFEIQYLFVALARSLGIEAFPARCSRHSNGIFSPKLLRFEFLPDPIVAVKDSDGEWHYFDPVDCEVDTGLLPWNNDGEQALIAQQNRGLWQTTPFTPPEKSLAKRTANLQLDADGTLTGDVRIELIGHAAASPRYRYLFETETSIEKKMTDSVQNRMPNAEVSDVTAPGMKDILKPFVLTYKVRVPNYAETTGQRMFVQPGFFTKGEPPRFTAATRAYDICFDYPMLQEDEVTIKLPDGYTIEEGAAPQGTAREKWGRYAVTLGVKPKSHVLVYTRSFEYSLVQQPAKEYAAIKKLFDFIHAQDTHLLTLKKDH